MSKLLPDIKLMVRRKNKSYLHSVYVGVFGATFNLPIAVLNGFILPSAVRFKEVARMYFSYMWAGLMGYADTITESEYLNNRIKAEEQREELLDNLNTAMDSLNKTVDEITKKTKPNANS